MSIDDYNRGRMDQQIQSGVPVPQTPVPVVQTVYDDSGTRDMRGRAMELLIMLKQTQLDRDEWKTYAKRLEAIVDGYQTVRDALRDEINKCPNHSAHPFGNDKTAQLRMYDDAYINKTKKNGLPESEWNDTVKERLNDRDKR